VDNSSRRISLTQNFTIVLLRATLERLQALISADETIPDIGLKICCKINKHEQIWMAHIHTFASHFRREVSQTKNYNVNKQ
jgi:hypothetical protein